MSDVQILMTGLLLTESSCWHDGWLWFCDRAAGEVIAVDIEDGRGRSRVVTHVSSFPCCIDWLP